MKNLYRVTGNLLTLKVRHKERNVYIHLDKDDMHIVAKFRWYINGNGYAIASYPKELGDWNKKILMHRLITECPTDLHVDHKNHKKLDNRRANLRTCTRAQNRGNSRKQSDNKTGYKGVYNTPSGKYVAQIRLGKSIHLGTFDTPEQAAQAYNKAALKEWGDFALLNDLSMCRN